MGTSSTSNLTMVLLESGNYEMGLQLFNDKPKTVTHRHGEQAGRGKSHVDFAEGAIVHFVV